MRYPVTFTNENELVIGVVHRSAPLDKTKSKSPGVILYHGFTGTKVEPHRIFVKMAEQLAELGIVALRFDFRGSGDSEGDFEDMTFGGEVSDGLRAIEYMLEHEHVDPQRLAVLGLSMGGAVAACVAGQYEKLRSVALWSAVADLGLFKMAAEEIGDVDVFDRRGNLVGRKFIEGLDGFVPTEALARAKQPVFVLHGTGDETVPVDHAYTYEAALKQADIPHRLHIVPEADHTFNSHPWETEVIRATAAWFEETLLK